MARSFRLGLVAAEPDLRQSPLGSVDYRKVLLHPFNKMEMAAIMVSQLNCPKKRERFFGNTMYYCPEHESDLLYSML